MPSSLDYPGPNGPILRVFNSMRLGWIKACPRQFQYSAIEGWESKRHAFPLRFGLEYQFGLELADRLKAEGVEREEAIATVVKTILERTWDDRLLDGSGGHPWGPGPDDREPNRNRQTLIRSLVWYFDQFSTDPAKTIVLDSGKPAVELSFQFETDFSPTLVPGEPYILSGHLDRVVEFAGETFVADAKTTTTTISAEYYRRYEPDNQMSLYTLASKLVFKTPVKGILLDVAQIAVGFTRFDRGVTYRTEAQLEEWLRDAQYWIGQAEKFSFNGYFPMNDKSCFLCKFKGICSKDPSVRQIFLERDFIRKPHDPLEVRG